MSNQPTSARAVVVGAGIVGNSLVYHLAKLGWKDMVLLDKGPLPNPGGSTGHASNFIFPVDHSKEMTALTRDSARQYDELGVLTISGGIEVARTEARLQELNRRMSSAASWGVPSELIDNDRLLELVPYINTDIVLGSFYTPEVSVVDSLRAGTLMREYAQGKDALTISASTEVTGVDVENGRVRRVHTDKGPIETEYLFIACGIWSPRIARMAGATIPLTPAVHQMISVGPIPLFEDKPGEIFYPIVRDVDTNMYERQNGSDMEVGSYAHRAILMAPDEIPSIEESALSPTELPFTEDDFELQYEQALELMPEILSVEGAGIRHAINGLLSLTPDGMPLLGETEVKNVWSVAAIWIKEAPGIARAVAEWVTDGASEVDVHAADVSRFWSYARTQRHVDARSSEGFNKTYGIVHPMEQWETNRQVRLSPFYTREQELDAVFFETVGWERPWWYESNADLLAEYGDRVMPREAEWESRWWSPIINAEHLSMRDRVAMVDLSAFAIADVVGGGSLDYLQRVALAEMDVPVGRVVYTPILNNEGGFKTDLTIMRLGDRHFRIVTGGMDGPRDWKWFSDLLPEDGSASLVDVTSAWCTVGVWGPRARDVIASITSEDISHEGFPFGRCRSGRPRQRPHPDVADLVRRRARLGDLRPVRAGTRALGHDPGGRAAVRTASRGDRRLRHHRPDREGLPPVRRRARVRVQRGRGRDGATIREGRRLRRQGRVPPPPGRGARRDAVHADRRRQHVLHGGQALHARPGADPHPRRRADRRREGPPGLCDERRLRPVRGQARPAGLPAAGARPPRNEAIGAVHGRALPRHGRSRRQPPALRPGERADQELVPLPAMPSDFWPAITLRDAASSVVPGLTSPGTPCVLASLGASDPESRKHHRKGH